MKKSFLLSMVLIVIDQAIKLVIRRMPEGSVCASLPGLVEITHVKNSGAAFSVLSRSPRLVLLFSAILLAGLFFLLFYKMKLTAPAMLSSACLLSGGVGNLIDRICMGGVTDYIRLIPIGFPVFNFADILITCAVISLIILTLCGKLESSHSEVTDERDS